MPAPPFPGARLLEVRTPHTGSPAWAQARGVAYGPGGVGHASSATTGSPTVSVLASRAAPLSPPTAVPPPRHDPARRQVDLTPGLPPFGPGRPRGQGQSRPTPRAAGRQARCLLWLPQLTSGSCASAGAFLTLTHGPCLASRAAQHTSLSSYCCASPSTRSCSEAGGRDTGAATLWPGAPPRAGLILADRTAGSMPLTAVLLLPRSSWFGAPISLLILSLGPCTVNSNGPSGEPAVRPTIVSSPLLLCLPRSTGLTGVNHPTPGASLASLAF